MLLKLCVVMLVAVPMAAGCGGGGVTKRCPSTAMKMFHRPNGKTVCLQVLTTTYGERPINGSDGFCALNINGSRTFGIETEDEYNYLISLIGNIPADSLPYFTAGRRNHECLGTSCPIESAFHWTDEETESNYAFVNKWDPAHPVIAAYELVGLGPNGLVSVGGSAMVRGSVCGLVVD
ncbi:unnamed protein product [Caenorhabditis bovis]|nr:unnamed protein product [Caenorhabditis bovis]